MLQSSPFGTRTALLAPLAGLLVLRDRVRRVGLVSAIVVAVASVAFVGLYAVAREHSIRLAGQPAESAGGADVPGVVRRAIDRFDTFDWGVRALEVSRIDTMRPTYGGTLRNILVQPIPRAIWPEKPNKTSPYLTQLTYDDPFAVGFTPGFGLHMELFVDFRWPGLTVGGALFGWILLGFESILAAASAGRAATFIYSGIALTPLGWVQAGLNSDATIEGILSTVFAVMACLYVRQRKTVSTHT